MPAQPPPSLAEAAVALVTAHLGELPDDVFASVLADVDAAELAVYLAGAVALAVRETAGGRRWLRRWGLTVAQEAG